MTKQLFKISFAKHQTLKWGSESPFWLIEQSRREIKKIDQILIYHSIVGFSNYVRKNFVLLYRIAYNAPYGHIWCNNKTRCGLDLIRKEFFFLFERKIYEIMCSAIFGLCLFSEIENLTNSKAKFSWGWKFWIIKIRKIWIRVQKFEFCANNLDTGKRLIIACGYT